MLISWLNEKALTPAVLLMLAVRATGLPPLLILTAYGSIQPLSALSPSSNGLGVITRSPVGVGGVGCEPSIESLITLLLEIVVPVTPGLVGSYNEASR